MFSANKTGNKCIFSVLAKALLVKKVWSKGQFVLKGLFFVFNPSKNEWKLIDQKYITVDCFVFSFLEEFRIPTSYFNINRHLVKKVWSKGQLIWKDFLVSSIFPKKQTKNLYEQNPHQYVPSLAIKVYEDTHELRN